MKEYDVKEPLERAIVNGQLQAEISLKPRTTKFNFMYHQNTYLNNSIRFADTKAGALVAVNGIVLKFIYDVFKDADLLYDQLFFIGISMLILGIVFSVTVVYPKRLNRKSKGLFYWENISYMDKDEYVNTLVDIEPAELLKLAYENNYYQAKILTKKFNHLHYAFVFSFVAYFIILVLFIDLFFL